MPKRATTRLFVLTSAAMLAFSANSLLCREALASGAIGAASFTLVRILSGGLVLGILSVARTREISVGGSWLSAMALFGYAAAFSFAYKSLSAGTGALLLFGAVQATMILYGLWAGERINGWQLFGALLAGFGLVWFLSPGVQAPSVFGALLMLGAGVSWGVYSLLGRGVKSPTVATAGNFIRAIPLAIILYLLVGQSDHASASGVAYAVASGALASGVGYAIWYAVLPGLAATAAATVQLSVPVIAAFGGVLFLDELITGRFVLASVAVLGGIAIFVMKQDRT